MANQHRYYIYITGFKTNCTCLKYVGMFFFVLSTRIRQNIGLHAANSSNLDSITSMPSGIENVLNFG